MKGHCYLTRQLLWGTAGGPVEEAQMLLDDHVVKSQAMAASPFSKPFEERLVPWEKKLRRFQVGEGVLAAVWEVYGIMAKVV